ncbi:hypothetical protein [Pedobacter rhizosphaerae]|uniref:PEP-CTERM protein-sorting domain-containing protein n=1 Tax=Pedobacter rhizosphaerae TaxID=390241 RepID=A0A1H9N7P6_9SPHI|nr:hypothetical protein [Pedobacter rhizosphaerae]SER31942.1 hypothetical protein SAMN04488023_10790 [Pedobacter rhizosphaerae]
MYKLFLIAMLLLWSGSAIAQSGCYVAGDSKVYTSTRTDGSFRYASGGTTVSHNNCVYQTSNSCEVYDVFVFWAVNYRTGYYATYTFPCPLDDYVGILIILAGLIGVFILRKSHFYLISMCN